MLTIAGICQLFFLVVEHKPSTDSVTLFMKTPISVRVHKSTRTVRVRKRLMKNATRNSSPASASLQGESIWADTQFAQRFRPEITKTLTEAVGFLVRAQGSDGLWRDFLTFAGESDEWVTAYVATALAGLSFTSARKGIDRAWRAMRKRQRPAGGWAYNEKSPADADSTAWGFRMAAVLGKSRFTSALQAKKFLAKHQRRGGGIGTCSARIWMKHFARMSSSAQWTGWCDSHPCVTAVAVDALNVEKRRNALRFLRSRQESNGQWIGYWWADHEYPTTLALDAMTRLGQNRDRLIVEKALTWISKRVEPYGAIVSNTTGEDSPFATACALGSLAQHSGKREIRIAAKCVEWLIENQRRDGAWRASATLRIPLPDDETPDTFKDWTLGTGFRNVCLDHRAVFTTAAVVGVLKHSL
jgi:prenyltransferase beta subunit